MDDLTLTILYVKLSNAIRVVFVTHFRKNDIMNIFFNYDTD